MKKVLLTGVVVCLLNACAIPGSPPPKIDHYTPPVRANQIHQKNADRSYCTVLADVGSNIAKARIAGASKQEIRGVVIGADLDWTNRAGAHVLTQAMNVVELVYSSKKPAPPQAIKNLVFLACMAGRGQRM